MKLAAHCRAVDCALFATAHVEAALLEEPGRIIAFDACAEHALGALNLAPILGLTVRLTELPCAWCGLPMVDAARAERDEPLHGACETAYDSQAAPS